MSDVRLAVIFYSTYATNHAMVDTAAARLTRGER